MTIIGMVFALFVVGGLGFLSENERWKELDRQRKLRLGIK